MSHILPSGNLLVRFVTMERQLPVRPRVPKIEMKSLRLDSYFLIVAR